MFSTKLIICSDVGLCYTECKDAMAAQARCSCQHGYAAGHALKCGTALEVIMLKIGGDMPLGPGGGSQMLGPARPCD